MSDITDNSKKIKLAHIAVDSSTKKAFDRFQIQLQAMRNTKLTQEETLSIMIGVLSEHMELLKPKV